jgi:hypothetical protein
LTLPPGWRTARSRLATAAAPLPRSLDLSPGPAPVADAAAAGESIRTWLRRLVREAQPDLAFLGFCLYVAVAISNVVRIGDLAMGAALLGLMFARGRRVVPLPLIFLTLFVLWGLNGLWASPAPTLVRTSLEAYGKILLITAVGFNVLRTPARFRLFLFLLLALFGAYPVRGALFNQFFYHAATLGRINWNFIFSNPNDLCALLFLPLGLAIGVLQTERQRTIRLLAMAGVGTIPIVMFLTQSRGGLLGLFVLVLLLVPRLRLRPRTIGLVGLVAAVVVTFAPDGVWSRMANLTKATDPTQLKSLDDMGSAAQRYELWKVGRRIIVDHPGFGTGMGAYGYVHAQYARMGAQTMQNTWAAGGMRDVHSTYLHVVAENGVIGAALFFSIFIATLVFADRLRRRLDQVSRQHAIQLYAAELSLLAFFVAGIFGSFTSITFTYLHAMVVWCMAHTLWLQHLRGPAVLNPALAPAAAAPQIPGGRRLHRRA